MKKIIVIGSPGAGKSVLSGKLQKVTGIPLYHMDNLYWHADRSHITREELREKLSQIMERDSWIIDGNYQSTMEMRLAAADTVIYMDFPTEVCIQGIRERVGKKRDDIPWAEETLDAEFLAYVERFRTENRPVIEELLARYPAPRVYRVTSRDQAHALLRKIAQG